MRHSIEKKEDLMPACYSLMHPPQTWLLTGVEIARYLIGVTYMVPLTRATTRYNPTTPSN
jgi:hypothetical protein